MVPLSFAGRHFLALPQGALFWPDRRALIVADLHFEKASWFARSGQMLPPYDSRATLDMLAGLVEASDAREVWCLGDSFHDADGPERLAPGCRDRLARMAEKIEWIWVTGNHDRALQGEAASPIAGIVVAEAEVDGVVMRHEADNRDRRAEISGHFHPKVRMSLRGHHVARRCFVRSPSKLLMPAFGALTGGLDAGHETIGRAIGEEGEALVSAGGKLLSFPIRFEGRARRTA